MPHADLQLAAQRSIADVSHELRSPLSVVKEYCSLVRDGLAGPTTPRQQEFLDVALNRIDEMSRLIDDLLDVTKIENGGLAVRRERTSIERILCAVWPALERRAAPKKISLELADEACGDVYCDVDKAARTLTNLAINAIKFTPANGRVIVAAAADGQGAVRISVTDSGPGIAAADLAAIFERHRQLAAGRLGAPPGYGLGLSIARELAGLNLGELRATSELGRGSVFSFSLPLADPANVFQRQLDSWLTMSGSRRVSLVRASLPYGASDERRQAADEALQSFPAADQFVYRQTESDWLVAIRASAAEFSRRLREIRQRHEEHCEQLSLAGPCALDLTVLGAWRADRQSAELCERFQSLPMSMLSASIAEQQRALESGARLFRSPPLEEIRDLCSTAASLRQESEALHVSRVS